MGYLSPQKNTPKRRRCPPKHAEYVNVDKPSGFCPKCRKFVKENGVECKGCNAFWHYNCAGVTQEIVDEKWPGDKDFLCEEHESRLIQNVDDNVAHKNSHLITKPPPCDAELVITIKVNSYTLNRSTNLKNLRNSLNQKFKVTPRDNNQQYHVKLSPPTYKILEANIESFGKQWGINLKGYDVDSEGASVKNNYSMELYTESRLLALVSVNFIVTTTSLHLQINKGSQHEPGWHEKVKCLSYFVNTILHNAVTQVEESSECARLHSLMETELNTMEKSKGCASTKTRSNPSESSSPISQVTLLSGNYATTITNSVPIQGGDQMEMADEASQSKGVINLGENTDGQDLTTEQVSSCSIIENTVDGPSITTPSKSKVE